MVLNLMGVVLGMAYMYGPDPFYLNFTIILGILVRIYPTEASTKKIPIPLEGPGLAYYYLGRCNLILRSVVSSRSPRVADLFHYVGAPYKYLYGGAPNKSPKIAPRAAAVG